MEETKKEHNSLTQHINAIFANISNVLNSIIEPTENSAENNITKINSEEDILKLMNDTKQYNDVDNNKKLENNKKISKILLEGLKEAEEYNYIIEDKPIKRFSQKHEEKLANKVNTKNIENSNKVIGQIQEEQVKKYKDKNPKIR